METIQINPKDLKFSPWNVNSVSPENMEKLKESLRRNGVFRPIVAREVDGELQVIAGEHTTLAAIELGLETIPVHNLGPITEVKAKEISIIDNQHYGVEDAFGLGTLLQEIDINPADFLPFSDRELTNIFAASKIDLDSLEIPDDSAESLIPDYDPEASMARAPIDSQVMRFKVPIKDAEFVQRTIEAIIKRQGLKQTDSLAAAGDALVYLCNNRGEE